MRFVLALLVLACFPLKDILSQPPLHVRVDLITVDDGLPQGLVWSILQDKQGFLWFATKDGLARYDGYEYRIFRNIPGDSTSLAGNHVTAIHEDRDGFIWAGTEGGDLHRYDPTTGFFQHIRRDEGLPFATGVVSMHEGSNGDLWVHEFSGRLCVINGSLNKDGTTMVLRSAQDVHPELHYERIRDFQTTPTGDLWLLDNQELFVWKREGNRYVERLRWHIPWPWNATMSTPGLVHFKNKARMLLVWERNVVAFDLASYEVVDSKQLPTIQLRGSGLLIDEKDRLWGQGPEHTWFRMDLNTAAIELIRPLLEGGRAIPGNGYFSWIMDRTGVIWAGTPGYGLVKYRSRTERFHRYLFSESPIAYSAIVSSELQGKELLVQHEFRALHAGVDALESIPLAKALAAKGLESSWGVCARDPFGQYWTGGSTGPLPKHLYRFDPRRDVLDALTLAPADNYTLVFPGLGHDVWALSSDAGKIDTERLSRIDTRTGKVARVYPFPKRIRAGNNREIACWRIANDSTIWMATGNGVFGFHPVLSTWSHYMHEEKDSTSIAGNEVFSICFDPGDPDHYLWVGTEGKGMSRMDMRTGKCDHHLTTMQGLPNDVIYGILPDARRNLWISTNQGLCHLDPRTNEMKTYTKADGIAGNEFNRYSAERSADGMLYFGGMEGITWFDPEQFYDERPSSPTIISGLKLLNKPVTVQDRSEYLPVPINQLKELVLPYSERMITLQFANMDHAAPGMNEFRYMLVGLNENWIMNGMGHEATFTNLDPGKYTFRAQGRNSEGQWDEQGITLPIVITPPWWATWWYRSLLAIAAVAIWYGIYRYRMARAMEVLRIRENIARDLHDEIGSTLSSVALYGAVARKKAGDRVPEASEMLNRITESTTSVLEAMNDIVWAVNSDNDTMSNVIQRMRAHAVSVSEASGILLHFEIRGNLHDLTIGMRKRKNLYLIFKEAVNNAVKYAQCSNLRVTLRREGQKIILTVDDDGIGFNEARRSNRNPGGNGLVNMHKRAEDLNGMFNVRSSYGSGTTVEVAFSI